MDKVFEIIHRCWNLWSAMFEPLPYGDPFLAVAALFLVVVIVARLTAGGAIHVP